MLRYSADLGPTNEDTFIHRLACVIRYHMRTPVILRHCLSTVVITMLINNYSAISLEPMFSFLFQALSQIAGLPFVEGHRADIFICEEIGQTYSVVPQLQ